MCDTMGGVFGKYAIFGKNSDRDTAEPQVVEWYPRRNDNPETVKCTYIEIEQVKRTHGILISRPVWLWGAEMGLNDCGVVIGNEALFTNHNSTAEALTGMDLLRLALERSASAKEALDTIIQLLERYGQGGNCGYKSEMYYDNAFLIMDRNEIYVLETCGKNWTFKKQNRASISNCISIEDDGDGYSSEVINFKRTYTDEETTKLFGGDRRFQCTQNCIKDACSVSDFFAALRTHADGFELSSRDGSGESVCMHGGEKTGSQTTSSMVVELADEITVWLTGGALPCISLYKPLILAGDFAEKHCEYEALTDQSFWTKHNAFINGVKEKSLSNDYYRDRDSLEEKWRLEVAEKKMECADTDFFEACVKEEEKFMEKWA